MSTTATESVRCTACDRPKAELKQRKSKVLPGVPVYICGDCINNRREPRAFIILAGKQFGLDHIKPWLHNEDRYVGSPITGRELT